MWAHTSNCKKALKLEALKEKQQQQMNGGIFVNAVPGSEVGINIANLRAAEKS